MPERRLEFAKIARREDFPAPSDETMTALRDIVDEGVLGASNHVDLALPLVARVAAAERARALHEALALARFIARVRGAGAPIVANALAWQTAGLDEGHDPADAARLLERRAAAWSGEAADRRRRLVSRAVAYLANCRAPLIYDYSSTVADVVRALVEAADVDRVIVPESRAIDGGRRYLAALADLPVRFDFVPDAALDHAVGEADVVLLGAESVTRDGGVINTVGSVIAARAAAARGVPVYGAADLFKVGDTPAAEVPAPELRTYLFLLREDERAETAAPELEIVPPDLVTAILTEVGAVAPGDLAGAVAQRSAGEAKETQA